MGVLARLERPCCGSASLLRDFGGKAMQGLLVKRRGGRTLIPAQGAGLKRKILGVGQRASGASGSLG